MPGQPDIIAIVEVGGFCVTMWLEVKTKTGRQSPDQILFEKRVTSLCGYYFVVRSIEDVEKAHEKTKQNMQEKIRNCFKKNS
jgi:hypothetical protein